MASRSALDAFISVEPSDKGLVSPPSVLRRDEHVGSRSPSAYELESFSKTHNASSRTPGTSSPNTTGMQSSVNNPDLEMSRPSSPQSYSAAEITPSLTNPPKNKWRYLSSCGCMFAAGLNDASTGALIPSIEAQYGISYGVVSIIFIANALGFITAATYTNFLQRKLGRARHMCIACLLLVAGYTILITTPPFAAVCVAYFLTGTGIALVLPPINVFICQLTNYLTLLGLVQGAYGVGGIIGPLVATAMIDAGIHWSHFYAVGLSVSAFNAVFNLWANQGYETDKPRPLLEPARRNQTQAAHPSVGNNAREAAIPPVAERTPASAPTATLSAARSKSFLRQVLSKTTLIGACFIFVYQGAEVAISGWVLSFLLAYRAPPFKTSSPPTSPSGYNPLDMSATGHAGSLGYVTSGFWAGLTIARVFGTAKLAKWFGEVWAVALLTAASACFQLLVWLIPSLIAESVAIGILGIMLGPVYPLCMVIFTRYLDRKVQVSSIAVISGGGSSGGALAPFAVGIISQAAGVWVLHPICLGLYAAMALCWFALNKGRTKRTE